MTVNGKGPSMRSFTGGFLFLSRDTDLGLISLVVTTTAVESDKTQQSRSHPHHE